MNKLEKASGVGFVVEDVEFKEIDGQKYVLIHGNNGSIYPFPLEKKHLKQISEKFSMGFVCEECGKTGSFSEVFIPAWDSNGNLYRFCGRCFLKKRR